MALGVAQTQVKARGSGTSLTYNGFDPAANSLIVVCWAIWCSTGDPNTAVADSVNGSYSYAIERYGSDTSAWIGIHYKENVSGNACNITVTPDASSDIDFCIAEITGAATSSSLDNTVSANGDGQPSDSIATGVLDQANEICISMFTHGSATNTITAVDNLIAENENNSSGQAYSAQYAIVSSTSDRNCTWNHAINDTTYMLVATFKEAAGGGSTDSGGAGGRGTGKPGAQPRTPIIIHSALPTAFLVGCVRNLNLTRREMVNPLRWVKKKDD